jgi:hypothetical protein
LTKRRILIQLDTDKHPSTFDRIVAIDAGVDEVLSYSAVELEDVEAIVHGAIFTRGVDELKNTALFIGGRNVARGEELLGIVTRTFFGPMRCSVLLDTNGANTTTVAAVLAARRHLDLAHTKALVLGGTGPVGQRVALLLAEQGTAVWLTSRSRERAADACDAIKARSPRAHVFPLGAVEPAALGEHAFHLVVSAGAAGVKVFHTEHVQSLTDLKVLIDLNAVPPAGIEGVEPADRGREANGIFHYGALGVGGAKMKIHKAAIRALFESNDCVLDVEKVFQIGLRLEAG